jgi:diadenylate cyclase
MSAFFAFLQDLKIRIPTTVDLLDIAIMWAFLYFLLKAIYRTRAMQMAFGLIALFVLQLFADFFNLSLLSKSIGSIFTIIPIAVLVLFQNEWRAGLASLGKTSAFQFDHSSREHQVWVSALAQATAKFSQRKIGALMVIEQGQDLSQFAEGAVAMDALTSYDLLKTIFDPKSHLHDGAILVRQGRIAAASVVLPLSNKPNIPKYFGTRHRAALGISEEFDCLVLIVSEETGRIRIAKGGHFTPSLVPDPDSIQQELLRQLSDQAKEYRQTLLGKLISLPRLLTQEANKKRQAKTAKKDSSAS